MIIETFGPPGAGKTTFSRALAQRLRDRGYKVDVMFQIPRLQNDLLKSGGFLPALVRLTYAIAVTVAILCRPVANAPALRLARDLLGMMPPNNPVWRIRLSQYILRLCCVWRGPRDLWRGTREPNRIVLFDQGFLQAIITLALFSRADEKTIARALGMRKQSDLLIRIDAPRELLEQRLRERVRRATLMERWFEGDVHTFLRAKPIADYVGSQLAREHQEMIYVNSLDSTCMVRALDLVEQEISTRLGHGRTAPQQSEPEQGNREVSPEETSHAPVVSDRVAISSVRAETELAQRLANASLSSLAVYVAGAGLSGLAQLVVARKIGAQSYGVYSYVVAWTTLLSYVAALGFNAVLLRFVAAYCATGRWSLARGVIGFTFRRSFLVAMLIALLGTAIVLPLVHDFSGELAIGLATVPLVTLYVLASSTVRALGGAVSAIAPERLVRDGLMMLLVVLAGLVSSTPVNASTVLLALMASSAVTVSILGLSLRKLWPSQLRTAPPAYASDDWWRLAVPVMIMIGVEVLMSRAGVILLGWAGQPREAGIFALGLNLGLFLVLPRMAVGTFFSPTVSRLHAQRNDVALQSLFARATVLSLAGTIILAVPLLVLTEPLLRLFGEDFVATAPIARVLVVGQVLAAATGPQLTLLTMIGHERAAATIMVVGAIVNIAACAIAIAFFGAMGAAIATAVTNVAWNVAMLAYISKRVNMIAGLLFAVVEFRRPIAAK